MRKLRETPTRAGSERQSGESLHSVPASAAAAAYNFPNFRSLAGVTVEFGGTKGANGTTRRTDEGEEKEG
jgi:hypothetical protein